MEDIISAIPEWLTEEHKRQIKVIYDNRPEGYHIDHIIPLSKGGLHVPWNLQALPAKDNLSKGNIVDWECSLVQRVIRLTRLHDPSYLVKDE